MAGVHLREATPDDAPALHALYHAAYARREAQGQADARPLKDTLEDVRGYIDAGTVLVAEDHDGRLLGAVHVRKLANVRRLAVAPDAMALGLGARLLDAAADWARYEGFEYAELDTIPTHPWLPDFYRKHGFVERGVERLPDGSEWLVMRRRLR